MEWGARKSMCHSNTKTFYVFTFLESSDFRMTVDAATMKSLLKYIVNKFSYDCRGQWNEWAYVSVCFYNQKKTTEKKSAASRENKCEYAETNF